MARVSVEQKALTDPRFDLLARFMESNRYDALGRMLLVWNECQERSTYYLPERLVGAILGNRDGATWLVESDLAEWSRKAKKGTEGELRIKGTEGRVEWLALKRLRAKENGQKGGRPPLNPSRTEPKPTSVSSGLQPETPPAPAPAVLPSEELSFPAVPGEGVAKPRERNALFDAIVEVTGVDDSIRSHAKTVGIKAAELAKAKPPYTPDEVREFGRRYHEFCSWARDKGRDRPSPGELVKWIFLLRAKKKPPQPAPNLKPFDPMEGHDYEVELRKGAKK